MTFVPQQNGILMNSQYTGRYRFFAGGNEERVDADSSPPYVVPFTVSILASQSIFLDQASTLIIPFYRTKVPYGYIFIIFMQAVTALLVKWAYTPSPLYMPLLGNYQSLPDFQSLQKIASMSQSQGNPRLNQGNKKKNRTLSICNRTATNTDDEFPSDPILAEGIAINLSFISPFSSPNSRASSLYTIELTLIKNTPGYLVPLITLIIYFVLKPFFTNNKNNNNNKNKPN